MEYCELCQRLFDPDDLYPCPFPHCNYERLCEDCLNRHKKICINFIISDDDND